MAEASGKETVLEKFERSKSKNDEMFPDFFHLVT